MRASTPAIPPRVNRHYACFAALLTGMLLLIGGGCLSRTHIMPSNMMHPTISAGDHVRVEEEAYLAVSPQRGDLVMLRPMLYQGRMWVFRVCGVPGDSLTYTNRILACNGTPVRSPAFAAPVHYFELPGAPPLGTNGVLKLSASEFFVLGDDPRMTQDSRRFGAIPRVDIYGKVIPLN